MILQTIDPAALSACRFSRGFILAGFIAGILAMGGCAALQQALPVTPPPAVAPPPARATPAPVAPPPVAALPRTPPPPRPEPFDPKQLIGLEANDVRGLVGQPNEIKDGRPATVWAYRSGPCALEVYFYLDLGSQKLRALAYDLSSAGRTTDQRAIAACADQFRAEFRDAKR